MIGRKDGEDARRVQSAERRLSALLDLIHGLLSVFQV